MTNLNEKLQAMIDGHKQAKVNIPRVDMIKDSIKNKEALVSKYGALATWVPPESTGRSPKDTVLVKRASSEANVDWTAANNIPITEETFDMLFEDGLNFMKEHDNCYVTDRVIGADSQYALPVRTVVDQSLHTVFIDNMFRPIPKDVEKSIFYNDGFSLLVLPYNKLDAKKYEGRLRKLPNGNTSDLAVAVDMDRKLGVVIGSAYMGSMKKMLFTVMNYLLPLNNILSLHCSANEGKNGDSALLLGLSGTGKTTLSADPDRALLGDDEHGWSEDGIANFEYGCYAKFIDINPEKEPEIYKAVMHDDNYENHGSIIENALMYPNGEFDFYDSRITENSRASYPLAYLSNTKKSSTANHPKTIIFLTADAYGVLPPISKLDKDQAMLWFLMGYTSKLAGTETGITEPQPSFSRFFGAPFMPLNPEIYAKMLGEKMGKYNSQVFLINTGWSGGGYGVGKRIDINYTRAMVTAALDGSLDNVEFVKNEMFHLNVPTECPNVSTKMLNPINTWEDKAAYEVSAKKLAESFSAFFDKAYGDKNIEENVKKQCPGK